jgi:tetratricopeptide (TPR) repeat protein
MYPNSYNVYDSYGEACFINGDYNEAIKNYKRSIELNPNNTNAIEMLKKIKKE